MNYSISDYENFFNNLKRGNNFYRLGKLFKTDSSYYLYDVGTGKIFSMEENVYNVLYSLFKTNDFNSIFHIGLDENSLKSALKEIKDTISTENILSAPLVEKFLGPQNISLENELNDGLSQLTLEVTERCNLRCKYCIYQDDHNDYRSFSNKNMSFDIAKKAIDFAFHRTKDKFYLSFYGGEPLLNFNLIQKCVAYIKELNKGINKELDFSMTTNATLITNDISDYLANENFNIMISLDGPENIHNENRVFNDGTGSFNYTIRGIKNLINSYGDNSEGHLSISMVITGGNYTERCEQIQKFFQENSHWLPRLPIMPSYASYGRKETLYQKPSILDEESYSSKIPDPMFNWTLDNLDEKNYGRKFLFTNSQMEKNLHIIHRRDLSHFPMNNYYFNGCCVPGARRLHVNVSGYFLPCERVGTVPYLGNVNDGFDIGNIKKYYVEDFMKESIKYCNDCWAVHLCTSCYVGCFDNDKLNLNYRHEGCKYIRHNLEKSLILYHKILEKNPSILEDLNNINLE